MEFNKISLSLFDAISYLLPGSVILIAVSVLEATFFSSNLLAITFIQENWFISSIIAYFLGQFSYRLASQLINIWPIMFDNGVLLDFLISFTLFRASLLQSYRSNLCHILNH